MMNVSLRRRIHHSGFPRITLTQQHSHTRSLAHNGRGSILIQCDPYEHPPDELFQL